MVDGAYLSVAKATLTGRQGQQTCVRRLYAIPLKYYGTDSLISESIDWLTASAYVGDMGFTNPNERGRSSTSSIRCWLSFFDGLNGVIYPDVAI